MSDDKKIKYESDTLLSGLKIKLVESKAKGGFPSSDWAYRDDFAPVLDKQNVVIKLIDHLKERF